MTATPRPYSAYSNQELANSLCTGSGELPIELTDALINRLHTFDEAKAVLKGIDELAGCQSNNYLDISLAIGECRTIARAMLAKMNGGAA